MRMHFILAAAVVCFGGAALAQDGRLFVTGEGVISVEPDIAVVRMGVVAEGQTPDAAISGMSGALDPVLRGLIDDGIDPRDIQTGTLSLRPVYTRDTDSPQSEPRIIGYTAQSDLQVTVRALDGLGGVLARATAAGSNTFSGLSWELSDRQVAEDAALAAAVADAVRKASLMAQSAGLALDQVIELSEGGAQISAPRPVMMESRMASDVPVARGSLEVRATATLIYSIQEQ